MSDPKTDPEEFGQTGERKPSESGYYDDDPYNIPDDSEGRPHTEHKKKVVRRPPPKRRYLED